MPITQITDPRTMTDQVVLSCDRCSYVQSYRADRYLTAPGCPDNRLGTFLQDHDWSLDQDRVLCPAHTLKQQMVRDTAMSGDEYRMLQERYEYEVQTAQATRLYTQELFERSLPRMGLYAHDDSLTVSGSVDFSGASIPPVSVMQYAQGMARGFYNGKPAGRFPGYMQPFPISTEILV